MNIRSLNRGWMAWALAFVCVASIAVYTRLYPLRGHIWSGTNEQATMLVIFKIKQTFLQEILQKAPNTPLPVANQMASAKLNQTLHDQKDKVREAIETVNVQMSKERPNQEDVYLLESDPFYFYNLTENLELKGRIADIIKGSKYFNPLMGAPFGEWQPFSLHPYVGWFLFKCLRLINHSIPLMTAVGFMPLIIITLTVAVFLWICRKLQCSPIASGIAALIFTLAPVYLKRSAFGWYDTDPYNLFFPMALIGLVITSFEEKNKSKIILYACLSALVTTLFALIWQGWGFIFFSLLIMAGTVAVYSFVISKNQKTLSSSLLWSGLLIIGTIVGIGLAFGPTEFFVLIKEALGELVKFTNKGLNLWPNMFIGVGELKKSTLPMILGDTGGPMLFGLSAYGIWVRFQICRKESFAPVHAIPLLILITFLGITGFLTYGAERFSIFMLIPLGLTSAFGLESLKNNIKPKWLSVLMLAVLTLFTVLEGQKQVRLVITPIFNSVWKKSLEDIKVKTPTDSIVNTWWPPGHFIKAIANRRVPFDGATLDKGDIGYWMSNVFLSTSEARAQGLLRMINTSSNQATTYLTSLGMKLSDAVTLINLIAPQNKTQAEFVLKAFLKPDQITTLLALTHGKNPHSYVLVYNELVDDNLILKFTGNWDFKKIEQLNDHPDLLNQIPNRNSPDFINFLWTISGGPPKCSPPLSAVTVEDSKIYFAENIIINSSTKDATIDSPTFGKGKPLSVVFLEDNRIQEHIVDGGNLNYSILLYKEDDQPMARLMDRSLANSLLMKLFYFNGEGLKHFRLISSSADQTNRTQIKVFETEYSD